MSGWWVALALYVSGIGLTVMFLSDVRAGARKLMALVIWPIAGLIGLAAIATGTTLWLIWLFTGKEPKDG